MSLSQFFFPPGDLFLAMDLVPAPGSAEEGPATGRTSTATRGLALEGGVVVSARPGGGAAQSADAVCTAGDPDDRVGAGQSAARPLAGIAVVWGRTA
jgi:hypothetical protein